LFKSRVFRKYPLLNSTEGIRSSLSHHISLGLFNHFTKLPGLIHFNHDIAATKEFTGHIQLWNGGPVGVLFDALTDLFIGQHVDGVEFNIETAQNLCRCVAETTLWEELAALHKEKHGMLIDQRLNAISGVW
jgi:hypothetical protein